MSVSETGTKDVVTASPETKVSELVTRMADEDVGTIVITEGDEPVGIVSDRMIALALGDMKDVGDRTAEVMMSEDLLTVRESADVDEVVDIMEQEEVRRVVVVDDQDRLAGLVSLDDVIVETGDHSDQVEGVIRKQIDRL